MPPWWSYPVQLDFDMGVMDVPTSLIITQVIQLPMNTCVAQYAGRGAHHESNFAQLRWAMPAQLVVTAVEAPQLMPRAITGHIIAYASTQENPPGVFRERDTAYG